MAVVRPLAPAGAAPCAIVDGLSAAQPLPHGTTLAMFTLVVFTLVTGTATSGSFMHAFSTTSTTFGGGFDVRPAPRHGARSTTCRRRSAGARRRRRRTSPSSASQSFLPVEARQVGTGRPARELPAARPRPGVPRPHDLRPRRDRARATRSPREVWRALARPAGPRGGRRLVVPRRDNFNFAVLPSDFRLTGFYSTTARSTPSRSQVRDPQTGRQHAPDRDRRPGRHGARSRWRASGPRRRRSPPRSPGARGRRSTTSRSRRASIRTRPPTELESAFLATGMEAESSSTSSTTRVAASLTFNRLIQGFMGLGLVVGVAALGVISARAVVERRQQIGVLRAIGFRRGDGAGALPARVVVHRPDVDRRRHRARTLARVQHRRATRARQPSWENLTLRWCRGRASR